MTTFFHLGPFWLALLFPLSAIVTLLWDWTHRNTWPDRFFWRHWWVFPILGLISYLLGIVLSYPLYIGGTLTQIIMRDLVAMLIASVIINSIWVLIQKLRRGRAT